MCDIRCPTISEYENAVFSIHQTIECVLIYYILYSWTMDDINIDRIIVKNDNTEHQNLILNYYFNIN